MKVTESQLRNTIKQVLKEQARSAGTTKLVFTRPGGKDKYTVTMTPAQQKLWAMFPKGAGLDCDVRHADRKPNIILSLHWEKRGGYANNINNAFVNMINSCGLTKKNGSSFMSPDGYRGGCANVYVDAEGNEVSFHEYYGVTKYENNYNMKLTFSTPLQVLDSDTRMQRAGW